MGRVAPPIFEVYPDRESNAELSLRRTLLYPFNYQGNLFRVRRYEKKSEIPNLFKYFLRICKYLAVVQGYLELGIFTVEIVFETIQIASTLP